MRLLLLGDGPLPVEHRGADRGRGQDVRPVHAQAALGIHVAGAAVVELFRDTETESRNRLVRFTSGFFGKMVQVF